MAFQSRELYRSAANGDRWSLIRDSQSGRVFIEQGKRLALRWEISSRTAARGPNIRPSCAL
jgi:hypothetical protein